MIKVGDRVWTAPSQTFVVFGTVVDSKMEKGWQMFKVDWTLPSPEYNISEWQKCTNLSNTPLFFS